MPVIFQVVMESGSASFRTKDVVALKEKRGECLSVYALVYVCVCVHTTVCFLNDFVNS